MCYCQSVRGYLLSRPVGRAEEEKIAQWVGWMEAWNRAREARAFARPIRRHVAPIEEGSEISGWLSWAENYANRIDPLRGRAPHPRPQRTRK